MDMTLTDCKQCGYPLRRDEYEVGDLCDVCLNERNEVQLQTGEHS